MAKYANIVEVVSARLKAGDYIQAPLPTEKELALEFGVCRMTARRALQHLVRQGMLQRGHKRRVTLRPGHGAPCSDRTIAVLAPAVGSPTVDFWRNAVARVAARQECLVRQVVYVHWQDAIIRRTLDTFQGVFVLPAAEPIPAALCERFAARHPPLVMFARDLVTFGIPTIDLFPSAAGRQVLDHLYGLGHRRIACFNTQPVAGGMEQRMAVWRAWMADHGLAGELLNAPVQSYGSAMHHAYAVLSRRLERPLAATALYCTTSPCAAGAMRALREHDFMVGRDVSVCATNDEGWSRFLQPSLTSLTPSNGEPCVRRCLAWMLGDDRPWQGSLHLHPRRIRLFVGESTGPAPKLTGWRDR